MQISVQLDCHFLSININLWYILHAESCVQGWSKFLYCCCKILISTVTHTYWLIKRTKVNYNFMFFKYIYPVTWSARLIALSGVIETGLTGKSISVWNKIKYFDIILFGN